MDMALFARMITDNLQYIILVMAALIFLALLVFISSNIKLAKLNRRYQTMMRGMEGANLERMLVDHVDEVRRALENVQRLEQRCRSLEDISRSCVQRVGIVRFNAFKDTGGDLSFAVALLDSDNNGVVISSIFAREDSRTYAKPVVAGQSAYFLTTEEKAALQKAKGTA